jgi:hypothetical protein
MKMIALMMEAVSISEMSVNNYLTTQRKNPEDGHLHTIKGFCNISSQDRAQHGLLKTLH